MRRFCQAPTFGVLLVALAAAGADPISAQTVPPSGKRERPGSWLDPGRESAIDRLFSPPPNSPGYALALIKDNEFVFARGYGLANLDDGVPITRITAFHLASLSKQFTAAAVALLILDQKIALSEPVAKYLPDVSKYGNGLRIEHLVYMTSGLHEYTDQPRSNGTPWMTFY
jgi:CubicO group peptidase (beta-lactamase class C family)